MFKGEITFSSNQAFTIYQNEWKIGKMMVRTNLAFGVKYPPTQTFQIYTSQSSKSFLYEYRIVIDLAISLNH